MANSYFITLEGIEGVGKSTVVAVISDWLREQGIDFCQSREPGGTEIAEHIRQILLGDYQEIMHAETELLLMFASRVQHIHQFIKPTLASGQWVVSDRFIDASFAYQGGGRELGQGKVAALEQWLASPVKPDLTFLLDAPVNIARDRIAGREHDRIEQEAAQFFERVRETYLARAKAEPDRFVIIDATQSEAQVAIAVGEQLRQFCQRQGIMQ